MGKCGCLTFFSPYREVPQASREFSPFELLYGHQVRGPLDVLKESWAEAREPECGSIHPPDEGEAGEDDDLSPSQYESKKPGMTKKPGPTHSSQVRRSCCYFQAGITSC